ncbi:hypothetical protein ACFC09_35360 [Streptomyces sp. NPDC056161]|uniref:hypothetical protein n=1 Tax=Streptomyces sp. NPDC056161 TaxID=3345732 RepID=UPI0035E2E3B8
MNDSAPETGARPDETVPQRQPQSQSVAETPYARPDEHREGEDGGGGGGGGGGAAGTDAGPCLDRDPEPGAPAALGVPRTPTGNAEVDGRLERLADADHLTTDGHVEVYEDVHGGLRDALTALDARPGPQAPADHPNASAQRGPAGRPFRPPYEVRS